MFSSLLLSWYKHHGRDLPWRHTRDPYHILVSEIMLQQTQVSRGLFYYATWLTQFPTFEILANASNAEVLHAWAGLGYNRRALMLRDIAKSVILHHSKLQSVIPAKAGIHPKSHRMDPRVSFHSPEDDRYSWESYYRSFKGIGPYTAAALAMFAHHERALPIDTNIRRVLDRVFLGLPFPDPKKDELLTKKQDEILPTHGAFWDIPQAIFDLATVVCIKTPSCTTCPLRSICKAAPRFIAGHVTTPKAMTKPTKERIHTNKRYPDRIYRGRILALVRESSSILITTIGKKIDPTYNATKDKMWLLAMLNRMEKDGMLVKKGKKIGLE